jgi:hypothetical protein
MNKAVRKVFAGTAIAVAVSVAGAVPALAAAPDSGSVSIQSICAVINQDNTKVYTTAGSAFAFDELAKGTRVVVRDTPIVNGRRNIKWNGGLGWAAAELITVTNPDC